MRTIAHFRAPSVSTSTLRVGAAVVLLGSAIGQEAQASLLVNEDFNYNTPPASTELNGQNGGSGFASSWSANTTLTEVANGGLTFTRGDGYVYDGGSGKLRIIGNGTTAAERPFASAIQDDSFYVSVLLNVTGTLGNNDFGAGWFDSASGIGFGLKANEGDGGGSYDIFARARLSDGSGHDAAYFQNLTVGTTYLVVARFSKGTPGAASPYTTADLWVNPVFSSLATPNASITQANPGLSTSVSSIGFRSANLESDDAVYFDALRIGTEWADVVTPVPEVSTVLAGALMLAPLALGAARRARAINKKP